MSTKENEKERKHRYHHGKNLSTIRTKLFRSDSRRNDCDGIDRLALQRTKVLTRKAKLENKKLWRVFSHFSVCSQEDCFGERHKSVVKINKELLQTLGDRRQSHQSYKTSVSTFFLSFSSFTLFLRHHLAVLNDVSKPGHNALNVRTQRLANNKKLEMHHFFLFRVTYLRIQIFTPVDQHGTAVGLNLKKE